MNEGKRKVGRYPFTESGLTVLEEKAALERLADPNAPNMEVLRRAGYAEVTLRAAKVNGLDSVKLAKRWQEAQGIRPAEAQRIGLETLSELAKTAEQEPSRGAAAKALLDYGVGQGGADERPDLGAAQALLLYRKRRLALRLIAFCLRSPERAIRLGEALVPLVRDEDEVALRMAMRAEVLGK